MSLMKFRVMTSLLKLRLGCKPMDKIDLSSTAENRTDSVS